MGKAKKLQRNNKLRKIKQADPLDKVTSGKIGKPQRSKKHKRRKPVDPTVGEGGSEYKQIQRQSKLKNLPPQNDDYQEIPRKVQFYMDRKADLDSLKRRRKKKQHRHNSAETVENEKGMSRPFKTVPNFVQRKGENDQAFMSRVERETQRVLVKAQLEDKYKVDLDESRKGEIIVKKKKRNKHKIEKLKDRKDKKLHKKRMKKLDQIEDTIKFKDEVRFGEVIMQPPSLTAVPRKAQREASVPRPGKRSLLLNQIIAKNSEQSTSESPSIPKFSSQRQVGQTLKRKYQSPAQQRILDSERDRAIQSYRDIRGTHRPTLT